MPLRKALAPVGGRLSRLRIAALAAAILAMPGPPASGRAEPPEALVPCLSCHGDKGTSEIENVPALGAQRAPYTLIQLFMFREGMRVAEPMNDFAKPLSDDDLRMAADFMAKLPPPKPADAPVEAARMEGARTLAQTHRCEFCHRPDWSGQESVPRLSGQREDYLLKTLRDYKSGARRGYEATMAEALQPVNDAALVELAYYIARFR